ncbi:Erg28 like protein-domain-containing protein [Xylogone sp. PMI_703]|nr:Erg28 like protein-domain-containing protein [Xylogone sp. PMI_703]
MSSLLDILTSYLPQHDGLLPKWLLFIAVTSACNSIQCYFTTHFNKQIYSGSGESPNGKAYPHGTAVTNLSSRTFGTWTLLTSVVRFYAAYNIDNPAMYQLAIWTYGVAWFHFTTEWLYYRTANMGRGLFFPVLVANCSLVWMFLQRDYYLHQ